MRGEPFVKTCETNNTRGGTNMKKRLQTIVSGLLALLLTAGTVTASAENWVRKFSSTGKELPTIDEVLSQTYWSEDKVEVSDNLDIYTIGNPTIEDFGDFKLIILERLYPEKEFTARTYHAPLNGDEEGFPDDYEGVDIGKSRVWIRCDLMKKLPLQFRANSMKDADLLLISESEYSLGGT